MTMSSPDFSSLISGILSNPEMLSGIMNAVSALGSLSPKAPENDAAPQNESHVDAPQGQLPFESKINAQPTAAKSGSSGDRRALLHALKPFLGEKRGEKIDFILKVLALLDAAEGFNKFK